MTQDEKYTRLIEAVREMRDLQKKYFATRDRAVLNEARKAEKEVDALLKEIEHPGLFNQ